MKGNLKYVFEKKTCPVCKKIYSDPSALSRKDNKIEICSICGTKEALEIFRKYQRGDKK